MLFSIVCLLCWMSAEGQTFDASTTLRKSEFKNVGATVTNISVPVLTDVKRLQPNMTYVIPNTTESSVESAGAFDYRFALTLPWKYMRAERLGRLPANNGISWRADSFLNDPVPQGLADAVITNFFPTDSPVARSM